MGWALIVSAMYRPTTEVVCMPRSRRSMATDSLCRRISRYPNRLLTASLDVSRFAGIDITSVMYELSLGTSHRERRRKETASLWLRSLTALCRRFFGSWSFHNFLTDSGSLFQCHRFLVVSPLEKARFAMAAAQGDKRRQVDSANVRRLNEGVYV